jgi:energy-coupling factor transport system ATP-binding protein
VADESHPNDLSEGQRLALVLAIQLLAEPDLLLLDEPTRGLDYRAKAALAGVVRRLANEGRSVVLSTHDVEFAAIAGDRVVVMAQGEVVADDTARAVLTATPLFAPQITRVFAPTQVLAVAEVASAATRAAP